MAAQADRYYPENQPLRRLLSGDQKKFACTTRAGQEESNGGMFSSQFTYPAVEYLAPSSI